MGGNRWWLLLEKSEETRVSKGIDGYEDRTGEIYRYDSLVPNHKHLSKGDHVVLRKEQQILGVGQVKNVTAVQTKKQHRRCPHCGSTDIRERTSLHPRWKCGKCAAEFEKPKSTTANVTAFTAEISGFTQLATAVPVAAVKACAVGGDGIRSQHSILELDPSKLGAVIEGTAVDSPKADSVQSSGTGQGFGLNSAQKRAVELRAMAVAKALYESKGWTMIDTSMANPYDFRAERKGKRRFVEVKGTTGAGAAIQLTHREVDHARANPKESALVVVAGIVLHLQNGQWHALDGEVAVDRDPWAPDPDQLVATQYRYTL